MGCGSSLVVEPQQNYPIKRSLINGFDKKVEYYVNMIQKQSKAPTEDLLNFIAYFLNNEIYFSHISNDQKECQKYNRLIEDRTNKLLDCLPDYIQSNFIYAFNISKILSLFSLVLFAFYSTNEKRQMINEAKEQFIKKIEIIEQFIEIEKQKNPLSNNIQFYLFLIKSAIIVSESNEREEIIKQFGKGLLKTSLTFKLDGDLLESLRKGVFYIYKEYQLSQMKRKYKVLFYIDQVKISFLDQLEKSNNQQTFQQLIEPLQKLYLKVIKQSQDWEIWCYWIYTMSDIISYKPKFKISEIQNFQLSEDEKSSIIHEINDDEFVFEINQKIASNKENIQNILVSHPLYYLQTSLLIGYSSLEGFEQIYLQKIAQNTKNFSKLYDDSLIIQTINFLTHIRGLQQDFLRIKRQEQYTQEKLQEQVDMVSDLITKISQLELQLKQFITWEDEITQDLDVNLLIEPQISELINLFTANCKQYKKQLSQDQFQYLFENEIANLWSILEKDSQYKTAKDRSVDDLKTMTDKIRKNFKLIELNQDQLKLKLAIVVKIIQSSILFLRINISILLENQVKLKICQNDLYSEKHQQNQEQNLLILYDYQLTNDSLQVLYQLVQQVNISDIQQIKHNRIKSKLEMVIFHKLTIFDFQFKYLITIVQPDSTDIMKHKIVHELCVTACENIEKYLQQLVRGLNLIEELIEYEQKMEKERNDQGLNVLGDEQELQNLEKLLNNLFEKDIKGIEKEFYNYVNYVKRFNQVLDSQKGQVNENVDQLNLMKEKFEKLKKIEECLLTLSGMNITKQRNRKIIDNIVTATNTIIKDAQNIKLKIDENIKKADFEVEIKYFKWLQEQTAQKKNKIQQAIAKLNKNLKNLTDLLVQESEINNFSRLHGILTDTNLKEYQSDLQSSLNNWLKENYMNKITNKITFNPNDKRNYQIPNYPKELESDICFLLDQIGSQDKNQYQQNIYDNYKEKIMDIIDGQQWRIRQTIVYSLIQIQDRCLQVESYEIISGLLVKLSILETDKRVRQLFNDQQIVKDMAKLTVQYWPTQEESIQKIIKQKLKELDALSMEISSESQSERKKALIKQFNKEQDEINNQIKNIESLSSSLGITVLFLQDLKNNLLRIESKLKELQDSVNEIGQNIKYLMGRPFIDLFEIRMNRVLEQAQIINAEKVYVPIKTRENLFDKEIEAKETTLYTPQIIGEGEINKFLWQQEQNSLLIHGIAGSGKSTSARKIEEFLWDLYQQAKMNTEQIPNLPIFISLPQLKDPLYSAVEETLKSDNYRFNERHIQELKEAVEQGKYRIIIIMDSYDELKQQYHGSNLNISNKLSKWKSEKETKGYPKIITTSRTELFTVKNYYTWFMSESNDTDFFTEIRLVKFNEKQIQEYLNQYYELSKKKIIRQHSYNQDIIQFEKKWKQKKQNLQIERQIEMMVKQESVYSVKELLNELWNPEKYLNNIKAMKLEPLLETAFILEIVVVVLPEIINQKKNKVLIKNQFVEKYSKNETESLELWNTLNHSQYDRFWQQYFDSFTVNEMEQVITKYFKDDNNFKQLTNQFQDEINFEQLTKALLQQPLTSYDFYLKFFQHYFDREIQKLREKGEHVNMKDLWQFTQNLALTMTFNNVNSVTYEQTNVLFKREQEDWRDEFFDNNGKKGLIRSQLRKCMPLYQKNNTYAFNHKSLQEFLVAKWFIENIRTIEDEIKFNSVNWQDDFLQGSVRFIAEKLKNDKNEQEFLFEIIKKSKLENELSVRSASNSIHLLNQMKYVFQNKDLSKIVLNNVDLSGINFYNTNLSNSNFKKVNISNCNFSDANLTAVNWEQTELNELAKLKVEDDIVFMTFLDETCLVVIYTDPCKLKFYDPNYFEEINKYSLICCNNLENWEGFIKLNQKENDGLAIINTQQNFYIVNYINDQILASFAPIFGHLSVSCDDKLLFWGGGDDGLYQVNLANYLNEIKSNLSRDVEYVNVQNEQTDDTGYPIYQINENQVKQISKENESGYQKSHRDIYKIHGNFIFDCCYVYDLELEQIIEKHEYKHYHKVDARNSIVVYSMFIPFEIHVYHVPNSHGYQTLKGHNREIIKLSLIKNADQLLSFDENLVIQWDLLSLTKLNQIKINGIDSIATHYNLLKFCIKRKDLEIWDIEHSLSKQSIRTSHDVNCCALSDQYIVFGSYYQSCIKIWDIQRDRQFGQTIQIDDVQCLQFSVDELSFYSSTTDGYIYQWELATQTQIVKINNFNDCIIQIFPIDKNCILTFQSDKMVKLWNLPNNTFKIIYNHEDDEKVEEFKSLNTIEYYERSKNYPKTFDIQELSDNIIAICRQKREAHCYSESSSQTIGNQYSTIFYNNFNKRILSDYKRTIAEIHKLKIFNYSIFYLEKSSPRIGIFGSELFGLSKYKTIHESKSWLISDYIFYKEQLIYHLFQSEDNKQIIKFRKLYNLNQVLLKIDIPQLEIINCFDIHEDILYFGGMEGTLSGYDINQEKIIQYSVKPHQSKITQIKYLAKYQAVLTVSEDAKIILSGFDEIIDQKVEQEGQPILFLSVSNDQDQIIIGTKKSLYLYFIVDQKLVLEDNFDQFENIKSLQVDFENMDILLLDENIKIKIHLSLKRITDSLQQKFKHEPSQISYDNEKIYIADDYGGVNCWDLNGKKQKTIKEYSEEEDVIKLFKVQNNQMVTYTEQKQKDNKEIVIYDLKNDKLEILFKISESKSDIDFLHFYQGKLIIINRFNEIYLQNKAYLRYSNDEIRGSDQKNKLLAIYGDNSLFKIYNIEKLSLQYNFSPSQELSRDNTNIKDARIQNQQGYDMTPIFIVKNAYDEEVL